MKKSQIAAQLYSFRDSIKTVEDFEHTLARISQIGYQAVQLSASVPKMPEARLKEMLAQYKLVPCSCHETSPATLDTPEQTVERLLELGVDHLAYPWPHLPVDTPVHVRELAEKLEKAAKIYRAAGIELAYHNHNIEFVRYEGKTALEMIYETAPTLQAEPDTYWIHFGGGSPLSWIRSLKNRMRVIHLKDYATVWRTPGKPENGVQNVMCPIGDGSLEWTKLLPAAEESGAVWFVVEHDANCPDPFDSFGRSMDYLVKNFTK